MDHDQHCKYYLLSVVMFNKETTAEPEHYATHIVLIKWCAPAVCIQLTA